MYSKGRERQKGSLLFWFMRVWCVFFVPRISLCLLCILKALSTEINIFRGSNSLMFELLHVRKPQKKYVLFSLMFSLFFKSMKVQQKNTIKIFCTPNTKEFLQRSVNISCNKCFSMSDTRLYRLWNSSGLRKFKITAKVYFGGRTTLTTENLDKWKLVN